MTVITPYFVFVSFAFSLLISYLFISQHIHFFLNDQTHTLSPIMGEVGGKMYNLGKFLRGSSPGRLQFEGENVTLVITCAN